MSSGSDPISEIEERKAQYDLGVTALRIYHGALEEGGSRFEAFVIVVAWFRGLFGSHDDKPDE